MIFNSIDFAIFLPVVFTTYWFALGKSIKYQNLLIVFSSYIFYGWWDWRFLSLIISSTAIDYFLGLELSKTDSKKKRQVLLWTSVITNLSFLGFFKYYNFFLENFIAAYSFFGSEVSANSLNIILPVGISFYTFQTLSYTIDVYNKKLKPTSDIIAYSAFVSFFPQLVAGPIERASHLLPQFYKKRSLEYHNIMDGFHKILWGLFKKIVIADRLAIVVNEIYNYPTEYHGLTLLLGTFLFAFQIYCDFSGYSDIAIGTARLFGFDLMTNFKTPYFSRSIGEFWRRWHISLSTWFRDYVYIPLGGNQTSKSRWYVNILIVFIISGLWHGAQWTFIIWGAVHGIALILESKIGLKDNSSFFGGAVRGIVTFTIVCLSWVFFRANNIDDALYIFKDILNIRGYHLSQISLYVVPVAKNTVFSLDIFLSIFFVMVLLTAEYIYYRNYNFNQLKFKYRFVIYVALIWSIYVLGVFNKNEFIYFQF